MAVEINRTVGSIEEVVATLVRLGIGMRFGQNDMHALLKAVAQKSTI